MDLWKPFRLMQLPEEQRAEVMKVQIAESEATKRKIVEAREATKQARLGNDGYQVVRGLGVAALAVFIIAAGLVVNSAIDAWHDVQNREVALRAPLPPPAPVPPPMPSFNITVTPVQNGAAPAASK